MTQKKMYDTVGTVPGEETAIFSDAYRRATVWGVVPLIGEPYEKRLTRPYNMLIRTND
ncbi:MAG: hypothetical protein H7255_02455 [Ramlibacter sp.]|nr:hypothetical protein [Ramlibacter sp.]